MDKPKNDYIIEPETRHPGTRLGAGEMEPEPSSSARDEWSPAAEFQVIKNNLLIDNRFLFYFFIFLHMISCHGSTVELTRSLTESSKSKSEQPR